MKHRAHKVKFGYGKDADQMLLRKLASNFFLEGKLETTKQKAKAAQSEVERIVTKAKTNTQADKNYILKRITTKRVFDVVVTQVASQLGKVTSGYTRIIRLGKRLTDGAEIARLEWAYPVVLESAKKEETKKAAAPKAEKKTEEKKAETKVTEKKENKS